MLFGVILIEVRINKKIFHRYSSVDKMLHENMRDGIILCMYREYQTYIYITATFALINDLLFTERKSVSFHLNNSNYQSC